VNLIVDSSRKQLKTLAACNDHTDGRRGFNRTKQVYRLGAGASGEIEIYLRSRCKASRPRAANTENFTRASWGQFVPQRRKDVFSFDSDSTRDVRT
jgi:hypothetical protein